MHQANQRKWAGVGEIEREQEKQKIVTYWRMFDAKSNEKRIKKKDEPKILYNVNGMMRKMAE